MVTKLAQLIAALVQGDDKSKGGLKPQAARSSPILEGDVDSTRSLAGGYVTTTGAEAVEVTDEFKHALELIQSGEPCLFVTGRAGTGKSTFVSLLKKQLRNFAVVAPTGVAALNVGGQTIHSFFKFPPRPIELSSIRPVRNRIAYQALRTLIIDEISMVRADLLDAIDVFLRHNGPKLNAPFGGVQVIVVGDLYQLPPIVATPEEQTLIENSYKSPFFFRANCLKTSPFKTIEFSRVFRQTSDDFISILNNIREGRELDSALASLQQRVKTTPNDGKQRIVLCSTNAVADGINHQRLSSIDSPCHSYTGTITGDFRIELNKLPAPMNLELKEGAQVMFVKNDKEKRWVNGTLGTVAKCLPTTVEVDVETPLGTRRFVVAREKWENYEYAYNFVENSIAAREVGKYEQIPLMPAWAVTIHKSQGKTFDQVHIDLGHGAFAEGQVYVALSRCRTLEGLTIERSLDIGDIRAHHDVLAFVRGGYGSIF